MIEANSSPSIIYIQNKTQGFFEAAQSYPWDTDGIFLWLPPHKIKNSTVITNSYQHNSIYTSVRYIYNVVLPVLGHDTINRHKTIITPLAELQFGEFEIHMKHFC